MRAARTLLVLLAIAGGPLSAQSRIASDVDTTLVTVGDRITLTVAVDHPAGSTVAWPDSISMAPFEVLDARASGPVETATGLRSTAVVTLAAFELGELEIPRLEVEVRGPGDAVETLTTDRFGVEVRTVGADEGGDIRGIRGPLAISIGVLQLLLPILLVALLAGLAWYGWKRMRHRERPTPVTPRAAPARPPHEVALEELRRLEAAPFLERGQVKEFHIDLSDILRTYVEARFGVPSLEMTTQEVLDGLRHAHVDEAFVEGFRDFLTPCDMVKFAKVRPTPEASRELLALGRRLVESTIPEPGPVTVEAA